MSVEQRIEQELRLSESGRKVLLETMEREIDAPFEWAEAGEVMDRHGMSAREYRAAAEELEALGVVTADTAVNHASGYARTRLDPTGFLRLAPTLLPDVDVRAEVEAVMGLLHGSSAGVRSGELLEQTGIPVGRLDLYVRAFRDLGLLEGTGPASTRFGSFLRLELTAEGREVAEEGGPLPLP